MQGKKGLNYKQRNFDDINFHSTTFDLQIGINNKGNGVKSQQTHQTDGCFADRVT